MLAHGRRDLVQSDTEQGTKAEMKILEEGEEKDEADLGQISLHLYSEFGRYLEAEHTDVCFIQQDPTTRVSKGRHRHLHRWRDCMLGVQHSLDTVIRTDM